jgi:hypothetical protein
VTDPKRARVAESVFEPIHFRLALEATESVHPPSVPDTFGPREVLLPWAIDAYFIKPYVVTPRLSVQSFTEELNVDQ